MQRRACPASFRTFFRTSARKKKYYHTLTAKMSVILPCLNSGLASDLYSNLNVHRILDRSHIVLIYLSLTIRFFIIGRYYPTGH